MTITDDFKSLPAIRCDRCNAQALASATKDRLELTFCLHHLHQHFDALNDAGWQVQSDVNEIARLTPEYETV
jgi:hypothetical protein